MSSEWCQVSLKEITSVLGDGLHGTPEYDPNGDHFFINGNNLCNGKIIFNDATKRVSAAESNKHKKNLTDRTILVSINGTLGNVAFYAGENVVLGKSACYFNVKDNVDKHFVRYVLDSEIFQGYIQNLATGSTIKNVSLKLMRDFRFSLPPVDLQHRISGVLTALDDRITLLRETNATLEAIAQAQFKSWFVDFDPVRAKMEGRTPEGMDEATAALFPDALEESELGLGLGLVPRGWRIGRLEECCSRVESGGTPKRTTPEYWDGDVSWLTSGEVRNPIVFGTKEKITALGVRESSAKLWPRGTTVVAMYGATAGEVCLLAQPTTANQACCGLIPSDNFRAFLFFCTRKERENLASKSSGSAQQNLNKGLVCCHQVLIPSVPVASAYENVVGALLDSWIENENQAQTLATLRDTLLPRLISGQLRLPVAESLSETLDV